MKSIAIIGAGAWGTALSIALAPNFKAIHLWAYEEDVFQSVCEKRQNEIFLPGFFLPNSVCATRNLEDALGDAGLVLIVVPSQHLRNVCTKMLPFARAEQIFVSAAKGLEKLTLLRMSEVIHEVLQSRFEPRVAALSGPSFAREVAHGFPTAVVAASEDEGVSQLVQRSFSTASFRIYTNTDVVGVELGGAVKNVIAIAAGVAEGMGLGSNAAAALITRGLAEMTRLACACGGRRETMSGLAGLGDLVLTCTGVQSRNRSAGVELGRSRSLKQILESTRSAIEGIDTAAATLELGAQHGIELPITEQMHAMLYRGRSPQDVLRELMERSPKPE